MQGVLILVRIDYFYGVGRFWVGYCFVDSLFTYSTIILRSNA